jgi:hypothetical protein
MRPWKPRASQLGAYNDCLWRAVYDRLVYEGNLPPGVSPVVRETGAADFGTCCHYLLQASPRTDGKAPCRFAAYTPSQDEIAEAAQHFGGDLALAQQAFLAGDHRAHAPTAAQWLSAAKQYNGDMETCQVKAREVASLALAYLPPPPTGAWICEQPFDGEYLSGHMDFLSEDWTHGCDLKTTSMAPEHSRVKTSHLYQMAGYHLLTGRRLQHCPLLYVDSRNAAWVDLIPCSFTSPDMQFFCDQVEEFCRFLMSDRLMEVAWPRLGKHCYQTWCPWEPHCAQKFIPPRGRHFDAIRRQTPSGVR